MSQLTGWVLAGAVAAGATVVAVRARVAAHEPAQRAEVRFRALLRASVVAPVGALLSMSWPYSRLRAPLEMMDSRAAVAVLLALVAVVVALLELSRLRGERRGLAWVLATAGVVAGLGTLTVKGVGLLGVLPHLESSRVEWLLMVVPAGALGSVWGAVLAVRSFWLRGWRRTQFAIAGFLIVPVGTAAFTVVDDAERGHALGLALLVASLSWGAVIGVALLRAELPGMSATDPSSSTFPEAPASRRWIAGGLAAVAVVLLALVARDVGLSRFAGAQQMTAAVVGEMRVSGGVPAAFRVHVRHESTGYPIAGAEVRAVMTGAQVPPLEFPLAVTDARGGAALRRDLPTDASGYTRLQVRVSRGWDRTTTTVDVTPRAAADHQILLTTDKPRYQPGQILRVRALVLGSELRPVDQLPVALKIFNSRGVRVLEEQKTTSEFGIVSTELELADGIDLGKYRVRAEAQGKGDERRVEVSHYQLPKFKATLLAQPFAAGTAVPVVVAAEYVFGEPVVGAAVELQVKGRQRRGGARELTLTGTTGPDGRCRLTVPPIEQLVELALEARVEGEGIGVQRRRAQVSSRDQSPAPPRRRTVHVEVFPERTLLVRRVPNRIYVVAAEKGGNPVQTTIAVGGSGQVVETSRFGVAVIERTPDNLDDEVVVTVRPEHQDARRHVLTTSVREDAFLLRVEPPFVGVGETLRLSALSPEPGPVFVDIVRDGLVMQTAVVVVEEGRGEAMVELDPRVSGLVQVNGYRYRVRREPTSYRGRKVSQPPRLELTEDIRLVQVGPRPGKLNVDFAFTRDSYHPGDTATLTARVTRQGEPAAAALGLVGVDEAVLVGYPEPPGDDVARLVRNTGLERWRKGLPRFPTDISLPTNDPERLLVQELLLTTTERHPSQLFSASAASQRRGGEYFRLRRFRRRAGAGLVLLGLLTAIAGWLVRRRSVFQGRGQFLGTLGAIVVGIGALGVLVGAPPPPPFDPNDRDNREGGSGTRAKGEEGSMGTLAGPVRPTARAQFGGASLVGPAPPPVRQHFPETLFWRPQLITDEHGIARVEIPLADSITTWHIAGSAVAKNGGLASTSHRLQVTQDFFADLRLPAHLSVGDAITIPVSVFNYLPETETVKLELESSETLEIVGPATRSVRVEPQRSRVVQVRLQARAAGTSRLRVTATGRHHADAIERTTEVHEDGGEGALVFNRRMGESDSWSFRLPDSAREGSWHGAVKIYPTRFSQLVEGLHGVFRYPSGCFEQTSSTTYPSVLALQFLEQAKLTEVRVAEEAARYIALGYQRLLSFEVEGGGFSLYGAKPASVLLTAYGLMEFSELNAVHPVDEQLLQRTRRYLLDHRTDHGWDEQSSESHATAYVVWALLAAGTAPAELTRELDRIERVPGSPADDHYLLALRANALIVAQRHDAARPLIEQLARLEPGTERAAGPSVLFNQGYGLGVETVALAALALTRFGGHSERVERLVSWLVDQRGRDGTWYTTSATVAAMRALIAAPPPKELTGDLSLRVNDGAERTLRIAGHGGTEFSRVAIDEDLRRGENTLSVRRRGGKGPLNYQLVSSYHAPWEDHLQQEVEGPLELEVSYAPQRVARGDEVQVRARLSWETPEELRMPLLQIGIPPGMEPVREDLDHLGIGVERYTVGARYVTLYLRSFTHEHEIAFRLTALHPMRAKAPPSFAYPYYQPELRREVVPQTLVVP